MLVLFALNGIELRYAQKELYEMVLQQLMAAWNMKICLDGCWSIKRNYLLYLIACVQSYEG